MSYTGVDRAQQVRYCSTYNKDSPREKALRILDDVNSTCDKCYEYLSSGILRCNGLDLEFDIPSVSMYHVECYVGLSEQDMPDNCTDCVDSPCFVRRKMDEKVNHQKDA